MKKVTLCLHDVDLVTISQGKMIIFYGVHLFTSSKLNCFSNKNRVFKKVKKIDNTNFIIGQERMSHGDMAKCLYNIAGAILESEPVGSCEVVIKLQLSSVDVFKITSGRLNDKNKEISRGILTFLLEYLSKYNMCNVTIKHSFTPCTNKYLHRYSSDTETGIIYLKNTVGTSFKSVNAAKNDYRQRRPFNSAMLAYDVDGKDVLILATPRAEDAIYNALQPLADLLGRVGMDDYVNDEAREELTQAVISYLMDKHGVYYLSEEH